MDTRKMMKKRLIRKEEYSGLTRYCKNEMASKKIMTGANMQTIFSPKKARRESKENAVFFV